MNDSRVTVITGGGRGIGAAVARLAARRDHAVAVGFRRDAKAADMVVEEITRGGGRALAVAADISDETAVEALFTRAEAELGPITGLVNSAAYTEPQSRLEDMDAARLQRVFATNVIGSFLCAREAIRRMSTRHGGSGGAIVNLSSAASRLGSPNEYIDYAASKGAIDTMTIGLAREVAREGIRVNAVRPGHIHTEFHATGGDPDRVDRLGPEVPIGRGGNPEEVATAVLWLLSDEASYTTGALLDVAGGR